MTALARLRLPSGLVLFNTVIALLLTALGLGDDFMHNLAHSQAIGLLAALVVLGGRHLLWPGRAPSPLGMGLLAVVGIVAGFEGGHRLAALLPGASPDAQARWDAAWMPALVTTVLATVAASVFFMLRERLAALRLEAEQERARVARAQAEAERARREAGEAQLRMLRAQLEPHMLFNTLANLRALIAIDAPAAQAMLDRLVALLRRMLAASRADRVPLAEEFALLEDWLALVGVRMQARLRHDLQLPDALRAVPVPPLLLQPLVENAVRHGLEPAVAGGCVQVRASMEDDALRLDVEDDGTGFDPDRVRDGAFGLAQLRERLHALGGTLAVTSSDAGTHVTLRLPRETP